MKESERVMLRVLAVARQYHPSIRDANRGGWSDLAHLLSQPGAKITPQMIGNWRHRKLPERIDFFFAEKIGCTVDELRGVEGGTEQELKTIDEENMTPEERMLIVHYRKADAEKQAALFRIVTGQPRPPKPTEGESAGNVLHFKHHRRKD